MLERLIAFRKELHRFPEVSGNESQTAERVKAFITQNSQPTQILEGLGGNGLAVIYEISSDGPVIAIRCELDALPIKEENRFHYCSENPGVSHKCGHDGHMAIVAGLSLWIQKQDFSHGKIVLLFQPSEETGKGAAQVLADKRFQALGIDHIFALHNIPGVPLHTVIIPQKSFSAEVLSFSLYLNGKECHASEPEKGNNPALAIAEALTLFEKLNQHKPQESDFKILTPIHIRMGEKYYGISPAQGELHYTIRTWNTETMESLKEEIKQLSASICDKHSLRYSLEWFEYFPASLNDRDGIFTVRDAAYLNGFKIQERSCPFSFGEDFGWFSKAYKATMYGLGAGMDTLALHHANYDFPDALISTGMDMFKGIILQILKT